MSDPGKFDRRASNVLSSFFSSFYRIGGTIRADEDSEKESEETVRLVARDFK